MRPVLARASTPPPSVLFATPVLLRLVREVKIQFADGRPWMALQGSCQLLEVARADALRLGAPTMVVAHAPRVDVALTHRHRTLDLRVLLKRLAEPQSVAERVRDHDGWAAGEGWVNARAEIGVWA